MEDCDKFAESVAAEVTQDRLDPARAAALMATLGDAAYFAAGDALPPFFHLIYFWRALPRVELGRDGHPKVGAASNPLIPDTGLPRRMWAGGHLRFRQRLFAGRQAVKRSVLEDIQARRGRSGPLVIVKLRHDIWQDGQLCLSEWQDLIYREDPPKKDPAFGDAGQAVSGPAPVGGKAPVAGAVQTQATKTRPPEARTDETRFARLCFSTTDLFRYSALTFNGHRIHYDADYAREVEGYDGCVVHGPLLAMHLALLAERELGPLADFTFRATAPLFSGEAAEFCLRGEALWVRGADGRQCMQAEARPVGDLARSS